MAATTFAPRAEQQEPEWPVLLLVLLALLAGWGVQYRAIGGTVEVVAGELALQYPSSWLRDDGPGDGATLLAAQELRAGSAFATRLTLQRQPLPAVQLGDDEGDLTGLSSAWAFEQARQRDKFRVLHSELVTLDGQPAVLVRHGFLYEPPAAGGRQRLPVVVEAESYLIPRGDQLYVLTVAADSARFAAEEEVRRLVRESVGWRE